MDIGDVDEEMADDTDSMEDANVKKRIIMTVGDNKGMPFIIEKN